MICNSQNDLEKLAEVIAKNIGLNANASNDKFFEDAGATLFQGIFLLTKAVAKLKGKEYADLMTAFALLSLPQLGKRLEYAREQQQFSISSMRPLAQLISVANSAETEASIIGTAQRTFEKFLKKDFKEQWPKLWDYFIEQNLIKVSDDIRRQQFEERYELVNQLFPLPPDSQN